ncbi:MAG: TonB-dependent receptor domain-containing protein [Gallionellaceae bacterium]|jgi:iron complex outermembrane receptor protein
MKFVVKPIILALATALSALANAADEAKTATLDEVVVNALRVTPGAYSLDSASLKSMKAATSDTSSLLRDVPGVSLYGAGGVSSLPVIHGLADDRLRVQVDGMNLISACGNHMNPPLSYIDPSSVGSMQVFGGIVPVSAGGDSIGGSIRVNSKEPEFATEGQERLLKGEVGTFYRSNGNAKGGNVSATLASETLSMSYNGSTTESGNYTAGGDFKPAGPAFTNPAQAPAGAVTPFLAADEVGSSRYRSTNQSMGFAMRNEKHLLELKLGVQAIPYQGYPNQRMDMTGNDSTQVNLRYKGQYEWGALIARAYDEHTRHKMQFGDDKQYWYYGGAPTPTLAAGMPMDTEGKNTGALVEADIALSERDMLKVGSEYQRYRLSDWWDPSGAGMAPDTFWNINDGQRDRFDLFGEWESRWNPQWLSQFGVRSGIVTMNTGVVQGYNTSYATEANAFNARDRQHIDYNWDMTALARYTQDESKFYEFGYAQKTRSPNLYELYAWSTNGMAMRMVNMAGDGNGYVGNLELKPEVAHTISGTAALMGAESELKITPYITYVQDYIDAGRCSSANTNCGAANQTATSGFVYLQFVNQNARLYGVDLSGSQALAKTAAYGNFKATGVVSYVNGKNLTTDDNLYNIMPLNAKLSVVQHVAEWTNTAEIQLVDAKKEVSQVRNELQTAGYSLLNLRSSYEWKQARFDLGVENVFDRFYNHPLGGAYLGQGSTMPGTAVPWGVAVPGMGRSLYAAVNVKF